MNFSMVFSKNFNWFCDIYIVHLAILLAMYQILEKYIDQRISVSEAEKEIIFKYFHHVTIKKDEIVVAQNDICRNIYFINTGLIRCFYQNKQGTEITRIIISEEHFCSSMASFILQTPMFENIQAIEETEMLYISKEDFFKLIDITPKIERIYRLVLEEVQIFNMWRIESFLAMDATERYHHLMKINPKLIQRVSNKILASYLNISPETLSRIKAGKK